MKNKLQKLPLILIALIFSGSVQAAPIFLSCGYYATNGDSTNSVPLPPSAVLIPGSELSQRVMSDETLITFKHQNLGGDSMEFKVSLVKPLSSFELYVETKNLTHFGYSQVQIPHMPTDGTAIYVGFDGVDQPMNSTDGAEFVLRCSIHPRTPKFSFD